MQEILHGNCLDVMKSFKDDHFTGIVTDPPYGLKFMNKKWDHGIPGIEFWQEMLRICAPGSWLMAFGGSRTYHRLTCLIEDAGWEIRDCIMWIYGSGFPKSKGCLKPAYEPIVLARKKAKNPLLNIEACRINTFSKNFKYNIKQKKKSIFSLNDTAYDASKGRWPANIIFDEESSKTLGKYSKYFYFAKVSSKERNFGCEKLPLKKNNHPTVKPLKLMNHLVKLITPFDNNNILDPFAGSGTTVLACKKLGIDCLGIEKEEEYVEIANERLKSA